MPHPEISGYDVLNVTMEDGDEHLEYFIGKIRGELHLLGWRPANMGAYFTENECSSLDLGKVLLPEGKKSLKELVEGDVVHINEEGNEYDVVYHGMA